MSKTSLILFIFALGLVFSYFVLISFPYPNTVQKGVSFSIKKGENSSQVAENLFSQKIIFSPLLFKFYLRVNQLEKEIKAGIYSIDLPITIKQLSQLIIENHSNNTFLIKEGDTLKEIERNLKAAEILKEDESLEVFLVRDFKDLFKDIEIQDYLDKPLEGFLYPDSYHLVKGITPKEIAEIFVTNFVKQINGEIIAKTKQQNKNFYEVLIIASLIEKEVKTYEDKRMVADILLKRLKQDMPLQVDASICYANYRTFSDCELTLSSFKTDSPFNLYLYKGLPPQPISNPSKETILAVLEPLENDFWYYLTDRKTSQTIFSKTYKEHQLAREKYLK
ncbi:MAG TPA: endolytic transglycosylase MltG [Candidatus Paceibacterota bacterium]|nr:endolytic transglycosylase MltG [Candidatus Paceibacterota bacterium]